MAEDQIIVVKNANDIVEVIGEYVPLRKSGRVFKGLCPFHDDHRPSLDVDPSRQRFRCWSCGKYGDVISFVQERERVDFKEALALLARRARITLRRGPDADAATGRTALLDLMSWAAEQYHQVLVHAGFAAAARDYLAQRRLNADTISKYQLGYAPGGWEWLTQRARKAGWHGDLLVAAGLAAPRPSDSSLYDRFRDRVIFPIRDVRGRTVGLGGRVIPGSATAEHGPKYYNSSDTPLFTKSEHLYGLDRARDAAEKEGFLAVVEGYTDVLMAHQYGVYNVVATLGTALNPRHIAQLRRFTPRVVLVFDADAGGAGGVDRALELFAGLDVDLAVAGLPAGLDPCDVIVHEGAERFRQILAAAVDALDFKLNRLLAGGVQSLDAQRRAIDSVLGILAAVPPMAGHAGQLKRELMVTRIAQRFRVREETIWKRLLELQQARRRTSASGVRREISPGDAQDAGERAATADRCEREFLEVLLAEPTLVGRARERISPERLQHPGLSRLLREMYALHAEGRIPEPDYVRCRVADASRLADYVLRLQAAGERIADRRTWLERLLEEFDRREASLRIDETKNRLRSVPADGPPPVELLRMLQKDGGAD